MSRWSLALFLVPLVACNAVSGDTDAAPGPDGAIDGGGGPDGPMTGPATVTVYNDFGTPEQGASVVFQHADGTVVQKLATDENGKASSVVDIGDQISVTQVGAQSQIYLVTTFVGVKPLDQLHVGDTRPRPYTGQPYGTMNVFLTLFGGATAHIAATGCYDGLSPDAQGLVPIQLYDWCHDRSGNVPLLALAYGSGSDAIAYATRSVAGGGQTTLTIDGSEWKTDFRSAAVSVTHTPTNTNILYTQTWLDNRPGREVFEFYPTLAGNPQPGDDLNVTVVLPKNVGTGFVHLVQETLYVDQLERYRAIGGRKDGTPPSSISVDASQLLPYLTQRALVGTGDPARPSMTWTSAASLAGTDGGMAHVYWYESASNTSHEWTLVIPPDTTQVKLPALPDSLAMWRPTADSALTAPDLIFVESDGVGGYDGFRAGVGFWIQPYSAQNLLPLLPGGNLKLRVTELHSPGK